ncbi:MAG: hypothetical protein IPO56_16180 [Flavobacteriales bacterium]|nr:hypothetical protein [Flavobacteriales bacterium]
MKRPDLSSYRNRVALMAVGALLLVGLFWKKKLGSTVARWQQHQAWLADAVPLTQLQNERNALTTRLAALDVQLASSADPSAGWKPVPGHLTHREQGRCRCFVGRGIRRTCHGPRRHARAHAPISLREALLTL